MLEEERIHSQAFDRRILARLWGYARPHLPLFLVAVFLLLVLFGLELTSPYLVRRAVDGPIARGMDEGASAPVRRELWILAALLCAVAVGQTAIRYGQSLLLVCVGQKVLYRMRMDVFSHLQRLPVSFFDRSAVGRLATRVTHDIETLNELFTSGISMIFYDVLRIVGVQIAILFVDLPLTLVVLAGTPILLVISHVFRKHARSAYREVRRRVAGLNAFLQESLSGMRLVQLFCQEERFLDRLRRVNHAHREAHVRAHLNWSLLFPAIDLASHLVLGGVFWLGGVRIVAGEMTFGQFLQFWILLGYIFDPIRELSEKYNILQAAMASGERIFGLLDERAEPASVDRARRPATIRGEIAFEGVSFSYQDRDGQSVLRDLSFRVGPGERIAIVGVTGAGKSTLIHLLARFYDPGRGRILIDGLDIRDLDVRWLRRQIGFVLQEPFLFPGSLIDNLRLGSEAIAADRVAEACRIVGADRFIERLPQRYETPITEGATTLSAGQKQLLALARTLVFDPRILVLDEATSNIDAETEALLQRALDTVLRGRTSLLIAHRLATIRRADRILVLHRGRLVESGDHRALLREKGVYHRLYQLQRLGQVGR